MEVPEPADRESVVGVTVPVPEPFAATIRDIRRDAGDPLAARISPHITLLPPTAVPTDRLDSIKEHLADVARAHAPIDLRLSGAATFLPVSAVAYLKVIGGGDALRSLQQDIRDASGPLSAPLRFPFHPHVTLAHEVGQAALDAAMRAGAALDAAFIAGQVLLHTLNRDHCALLARIPLGGAAPA